MQSKQRLQGVQGPLENFGRSYEKLIVWREAFMLCLETYKISRHLPKDEQFGLISQMRRAASSVPLNIVEGNARISKREKIRFFNIAKASLEELHCELRIACELEWITRDAFLSLDKRIHRTSFLLHAFVSSLKRPLPSLHSS